MITIFVEEYFSLAVKLTGFVDSTPIGTAIKFLSLFVMISLGLGKVAYNTYGNMVYLDTGDTPYMFGQVFFNVTWASALLLLSLLFSGSTFYISRKVQKVNQLTMIMHMTIAFLMVSVMTMFFAVTISHHVTNTKLTTQPKAKLAYMNLLLVAECLNLPMLCLMLITLGVNAHH